MEPNSYSGSANVYAFPAGGRGGERARREETSLTAQGIATAPVGSSWYHDAAMQEEKIIPVPNSAPWWAQAESESQAKSVAIRLF